MALSHGTLNYLHDTPRYLKLTIDLHTCLFTCLSSPALECKLPKIRNYGRLVYPVCMMWPGICRDSATVPWINKWIFFLSLFSFFICSFFGVCNSISYPFTVESFPEHTGAYRIPFYLWTTFKQPPKLNRKKKLINNGQIFSIWLKL